MLLKLVMIFLLFKIVIEFFISFVISLVFVCNFPTSWKKLLYIYTKKIVFISSFSWKKFKFLKNILIFDTFVLKNQEDYELQNFPITNIKIKDLSKDGSNIYNLVLTTNDKETPKDKDFINYKYDVEIDLNKMRLRLHESDNDFYDEYIIKDGIYHLRTIYYSVSDVKVKVGDELKQGDVIARSGVSKISEDKANLLFEVYYNGVIINPEAYYEMDVSTLK